MQLIRCTGKLQKEMGLKKSDLCEVVPKFSYLGSWHANLIYIDRRKCVVFANDKTLFNFIATDVSRAQIRELDTLFRGLLHCVLSDEGFEPAVKEKIVAEYDAVAYAKTNNRSVLGSMNDLIFHYKLLTQNAGGVHSFAVPGIIRQLNRMPMQAISYKFPIVAMRAMYP
jgi:hypothetical protein